MYSNTALQYDLFDYAEEIENSIIKPLRKNEDKFEKKIIEKLSHYSLECYIDDIKTIGLKKTWDNICKFIKSDSKHVNEFLRNSNFGQLYEMGLAEEDKEKKKSNGQYFTPEDVATIMAQWFANLDAENVCDVACGTGNLILNYLEIIGIKKATELISSGKLYLYDFDETALNICKTSILLKYGIQYKNMIHDIYCDFLDMKIHLPENCKVISNPPYARIESISYKWGDSEIISNTKEYYAAFIEKIIKQSKRSVIITPFSFMGGTKFYSLRKLMNNYNGFIVAFDNVPGNIFSGKKFGIFNTNTSNSVRAAITVIENKENKKGFRTSSFIRFKNIEREKLLNTKVLESFLSDEYQIITSQNSMYFKCNKELTEVYKIWKEKSSKTLSNYVCENGQFLLSMPNTCRYITVASSKELKRSGQIILRFSDKDVYNFVYCLINSSFAYWYWRLYDGGITYQKGLLLSLPIFYDLLTIEDKKFFEKTTEELQKIETKCIVTKTNVGIQENLRFPKIYREKINQKLFDILNIKKNISLFNSVHSNMALEENVCDK